MQNQTVKEGKTMAIISYFWWVGLVISFILNNSKKNTFTEFHIRQVIGLLLISLAANITYMFTPHMVGYLPNLGIFILWAIGLVGAFNGEEKKVPLFGDLFQEWFKGIS